MESVKLPPRSPNLNSYAERFVRSIKESCLERMVLFGEKALRKAVGEFITHYHTERNHQGIGNLLIMSDRLDRDHQGIGNLLLFPDPAPPIAADRFDAEAVSAECSTTMIGRLNPDGHIGYWILRDAGPLFKSRWTH